ncbi:ATPase AAA [Clostridiales bacterium PH28_bin88]|nr:ATPase AAA [Clostridiales bacterium PH28_bin88]
MGQPLAEKIQQEICQAESRYQRLVLVVGPAGAGKTVALRDLAGVQGYPLLNLNRVLSERLLELREHQRPLQVLPILREIISSCRSRVVLLDNIELLFDIGLKQDPLRLLQDLSRQHTIVAAWNGKQEGGYLVYAEPEHPEYRRYPVRELQLVVTG